MAFGKKEETITIKAPNFVEVLVHIEGDAPLVIHKFSKKTECGMREKMTADPATKKSKSARPARDFEADFNGARHISTEGWDGIHAGAFRNAMIDACRTVGVVMTRAKLAVFIVADGVDADSGTPLVRILSDKPENHVGPARNSDGSIDIRARPMYRKWKAAVRIRFDADMIDATSVLSLMSRVGLQVGVGEGRPYSKSSAGCGWGTFVVTEGAN